MVWEPWSIWLVSEVRAIWANSGNQCQNCVAIEHTPTWHLTTCQITWSPLHTLIHLILMASFWSRYYWDPFTDEEGWGTKRLNDCPICMWQKQPWSLYTCLSVGSGWGESEEGRFGRKEKRSHINSISPYGLFISLSKHIEQICIEHFLCAKCRARELTI